MMELTADAQRMLEEYLRRADAHLRGASVGDAEEVESDLREHVERALQDAPQPISARAMEGVLERLGNPTDLVPEEDLSWWRQAARRWQTGSDDWRLAYLSLGLLIFGVMLGGLVGLGYLGVLGSFLISRAALAVAEDEEDLGPKKWLLYPSLIIVYIPLAILLLWWPLVPLPIILSLKHSPIIRPAISILLFALPVWWLVLIAITRYHPRFLPTLFRPFVKSSGTSLLLRVMLYSFLLFLLCYVVGLWWPILIP